MKKLALITCIIVSSVSAFAQTAPNDNVTSLRGRNGSSYTFTTTGTSDGSAWGGANGIYTDDTRLGKAAVHAGLLQIGQTGNVTVTILGGQNSYQGSTRNGISTQNYGSWSGSFQFGAAQNISPSTATAPANMTAYRGNNGTAYTFTVVGTNDGGVWGGADGIYTDDSKISTAAVHAGVVGVGQSATIRVTVVAGQSGYRGNNQHGIGSKDYGSWHGSYTFGNTGQSNVTNVANAPGNMTEYRGNNGTLYTFSVIGTTDGSVWGGANGIYTDDSKLSTAAVHAGVVGPGQQATVRVRIVQGQPGYQGSTRNGVATKDYGSWHGSYKFE